MEMMKAETKGNIGGIVFWVIVVLVISYFIFSSRLKERSEKPTTYEDLSPEEKKRFHKEFGKRLDDYLDEIKREQGY